MRDMQTFNLFLVCCSTVEPRLGAKEKARSSSHAQDSQRAKRQEMLGWPRALLWWKHTVSTVGHDFRTFSMIWARYPLLNPLGVCVKLHMNLKTLISAAESLGKARELLPQRRHESLWTPPSNQTILPQLALRIQVPKCEVSTPNHTCASEHGSPTYPTFTQSPGRIPKKWIHLRAP